MFAQIVVEVTVAEGKKFDEGKPPLGLLSREALVQVARVLAFGAAKYDAHNWRQGIAWQRPLDAAMRHILAFNEGEDNDTETGLSHLAHAMCELMFVLEFQHTHPELDNRFKHPAGSLAQPEEVVKPAEHPPWFRCICGVTVIPGGVHDCPTIYGTVRVADG